MATMSSREQVEERHEESSTMGSGGAVMWLFVVLGVIEAIALIWVAWRGPSNLSAKGAFLALGLNILVIELGLAYLLHAVEASRAELSWTRSELETLRGEVRSKGSRAAAPEPVRAPITRKEPQPVVQVYEERTPAHEYAETVQNQSVIEIEGIGPIYTRKLADQGITSIGHLSQADADEIAPLIGTNATTVRQWQSMGDLMRVDGIGKQFAELLVRSGTNSVEELAQSKPAEVLARIQKTEAGREVRIQGATITIDRVKGWIHGAKQL